MLSSLVSGHIVLEKINRKVLLKIFFGPIHINLSAHKFHFSNTICPNMSKDLVHGDAAYIVKNFHSDFTINVLEAICIWGIISQMIPPQKTKLSDWAQSVADWSPI